MKIIGIILLVTGIAFTIFTGFNYVTKEKIVDVGPLEISADKKNSVGWSPLIGVGIIIIGGAFFLAGTKRS